MDMNLKLGVLASMPHLDFHRKNHQCALGHLPVIGNKMSTSGGTRLHCTSVATLGSKCVTLPSGACRKSCIFRGSSILLTYFQGFNERNWILDGFISGTWLFCIPVMATFFRIFHSESDSVEVSENRATHGVHMGTLKSNHQTMLASSNPW